MGVRVEVCVEGVDAAVAAGEGGADRVELCAAMEVEGLTPDPADVAAACRRLAIPVHVLVRPRGGDFLYSDEEFGAMLRQVAWIRDAGAAGVVVGVNRADGSVDLERTAALVAAARPLSVTFHKAFDALSDLAAGYEALAGLGLDRVLTSGGAPTAREGLQVLAGLARRSRRGGPVIMAGGRLTLDDLGPLLGAGVLEVHVGSAAKDGGRTDPGRVRLVVETARRLAGGS